MKTVFFVLCFIVFISVNPLSGQDFKFYPIPSFNVLVDPAAIFQDMQGGSNSKAKREIIVHTKKSNKSDSSSCFASVTLYTLDHQTILGPYTVNCDETLSVEIDDRDWGVSVTSLTEIEVSVWIELQGLLKKMNNPLAPQKEQEVCEPD